MGQCVKCRDFYPPEFSVDLEDDKKMCIFCKRDTNEIINNGLKITRAEVIKEYKEFCNELRYRHDLLKDYSDGKIDLKNVSRIIKP